MMSAQDILIEHYKSSINDSLCIILLLFRKIYITDHQIEYYIRNMNYSVLELYKLQVKLPI